MGWSIQDVGGAASRPASRIFSSVMQKRSKPRFEAGKQHRRSVERTVTEDVLPHLMRTYSMSGDYVHPDLETTDALAMDAMQQSPSELIASHVARGRHDDARRCIEILIQSGEPVEQIMLTVIQPAAQRLGELWISDELGFAEVTLGSLSLQRLMQDVSPLLEHQWRDQQSSGRVFLSVVPGEQHGLGLLMVAEFFRARGWSVMTEAIETIDDLLGLVRSGSFDLVGLSAGRDSALADVTEAVNAVRSASNADSIGVMVGGPLFLVHPNYTTTCGADFSATDALDAIEKAEKFIAG